MTTQNHNNDIILIEDYLDGKLNEKEKMQFQRRLESDPELAKLYNFRLQIKDDWQRAQQYVDTKQQVASTIHKVKHEKRRKIIYTVAASLALLIVISGVFTLLNRSYKPSQMAGTKSDTLNEKSYQPQIKEPESYADSGHYYREGVPEKLSLSFSVENDSLIFMWQPSLKKELKLVIVSSKNEKELFTKQLPPFSRQMVIHRKELPAGKMIWYIEGFAERDTFKLTEIY
jgi:hypothetical protein